MTPQKPPGTTPAIAVTGLTKNFDQVRALDGIDFTVRQGEIFGFLGPNGAGKTTAINIITGLARADQGSVAVLGLDCTQDTKAAQHLIGVVADESNLYPELSGLDNLCFCGALYGMSKKVRMARAMELLEAFGLAEVKSRRFGAYSKGMKRKLTIAAAIMHKPALLFLDEPTTGIDVASARQIRTLIADMNTSGTTVFLTTHHIEEAERLCGRVAFIVEGRIVRVDSVDALLSESQGRHRVQFELQGLTAEALQALQQARPELDWESRSGGLLRLTSRTPVPIGDMVRFFEEHGLEVTEARKIRPSLEDVFVRVTGLEVEGLHRKPDKGKP